MKDRRTYKILTAIGCLGIPLGRIYIGEKFGMRLMTLNYLLIGGWFDLAFMDKRFDEAMAKRGFINTDIRNKQGK